MKLRAKLHSNEPSAVKATEQTILQLVKATEFIRFVFRRKSFDSDELALDKDGWVELVPMPNEGLIKFACERQGYVLAIEEVPEAGELVEPVS